MGIFGGGTSFGGNWTRTPALGGRISFELPDAPKRREMTKHNMETWTVQIHPGTGASKMDIVTYTVALARSDQYSDLEKWIEDSLTNTANAAKSSINPTKTRIGGFPAARVDYVTRGQRARQVMVAIPGHMLSVSVMQRDNARVVPEDEIQRVLGSVQLPGFQQNAAPPSPPVQATPPSRPAPPPGPAVQSGAQTVSPSPGNMYTADQLTPAVLQSLLSAAGLQASFDPSGRLVVSEGRACWLDVDPAEGYLRLTAMNPTTTPDEAALLRYVNSVNQHAQDLRASVSPQGAIAFDTDFPLYVSVGAPLLLTVFRRFVQRVDKARQLDQAGMLQ